MGRRPVASGSRPEERVAISACSSWPASPDSSQRFRLRYHGRKRQFSCTINRALPATRPASASAGRKARCQGLLAEHVDPAGRGGLDQRRMGLARRGDIDGVELMPGEHGVEVAVDGGDGELRGAAIGLREVGIAERDDLRPRVTGPGDEMVVADHPGAGEADPQRRPSPDFAVAVMPQIRTGGRDCAAAPDRGRRHREASGRERPGHRHSGCRG